jgi:hypothetical protein
MYFKCYIETNIITYQFYSYLIIINKILLIGIIQHEQADDIPIMDNCIKHYCKLNGNNNCARMKQLRTILISRREARGAMYSHAYEDKLTNNEEFCLETESHVVPVQVSCIFISLLCHLFSLTCLTFHFVVLSFDMIGLGYEAYEYVG